VIRQISPLFLCVAWSAASQAQEALPLPVRDAVETRSFGELLPIEFSPDGKWLAYTVQRSQSIKPLGEGRWPETGVFPFMRGLDLWVVNTETLESQELTKGEGDNWLPTWSPDGHFLAFFSTRDGSGQPKLWIWDTAKNEIRKVSDTIVRSLDLEWEPGSRNVLFTTLPEGLSVEDYVRRVSSIEKDAVKPAGEAGSTVTVYRSSANVPGRKETSGSDPWNLNEKLVDLASVEVGSGRVSALVHSRRIATFRISPDGSGIAYTIPKRFEKPGSQQILYDLAVIPMAANRERIIATDIRQGYDGSSFSWSPDGSLIGYRDIGPGETATYDCFLVRLKDSFVRNVTTLSNGQHRSRYESGPPLWDRNGNYLYFVHNGALWRASVNQDKAVEFARIPNREIMWWLIAKSKNLLSTTHEDKETIVLARDELGKRDGFYKIDLSSSVTTKLLEKDECYTCIFLKQPAVATKDGKRLAYFAEDSQHENNLWVSDAGFENTHQLTHLNPQLDAYRMGSARVVEWLSDDGEPLQGALLLPVGYQEGKHYPLIVYVYGGGRLSRNVHQFGLVDKGPFNMQLLATRGYAVLCPDAPQNLGTPMLDLAKTVLPGINKVIEMGIADRDHLGVMGHSYGGYSSLSLIVQTKRFKAAIEADGYGDLMGHYGEMDKDGTAYGTAINEQAQGLIGGTPWQFRDRYIENSPIFHFDMVETPLLIVHGAADTDVMPFLADEVFVALRRLGKGVEYAKYEGEGHSLLYWSYANQEDFCNRMIIWFDKYLKPTVN